jgi:hypothetical protein
MMQPLRIASIAEAVTGALLIAVPTVVTRWLFGAEVTGVGEPTARVAGVSLLALGIACWPVPSWELGGDRGGSGGPVATPAAIGMFAYNLLTTVYLVVLGIRGEWVGPLLWPAAALHAALTVLLAHGVVRGKSATASARL